MRGRRATLHPMFFGSFDWHSCVHGWWLLLRLLRRFPGHAHADAVANLAAETFTPAKVAVEPAYFERPSARGFERPYGWAWLLALHAEAKKAANPAISDALAPLAAAIAARFHAHLPVLTYPIRTGAHGNTAFALVLAAGWAMENDAKLLRFAAGSGAGLVSATTGMDAVGARWRCVSVAVADRGGQLWRRCCRKPSFRRWFADFLPAAAAAPAGDAVRAAARQRPHRRQDRPSRRAQPQPRLVLESDRRPAGAR